MKTHRSVLLLVPALVILLLGVIIPGGSFGANIVLDESMISYTPEEPTLADSFNVTVDPLFIDADPVEGGVVLMWSLCTEDGCGIAQPKQMTDNGDGTWSAELGGPFPDSDPGTGKDYVDILFYVKITATPDGGGDNIVEQSDSLTIYFKDPDPVDDDDDTTPVDDDDDDDNGDDSPLGIEVLLIGGIVAGAIAIFRRKD